MRKKRGPGIWQLIKYVRKKKKKEFLNKICRPTFWNEQWVYRVSKHVKFRKRKRRSCWSAAVERVNDLLRCCCFLRDSVRSVRAGVSTGCATTAGRCRRHWRWRTGLRRRGWRTAWGRRRATSAWRRIATLGERELRTALRRRPMELVAESKCC